MNTPTTLAEFKALSVLSYKDIKKGDILYCGDTKLEIISDVYYFKTIGISLWVDTIKTFKSPFSGNELLSVRSSESLNDKNVTNGGYSPWMLFVDKNIALLHQAASWWDGEIFDDMEMKLIPKLMTAEAGETLTNEFIIKNFENKSTIK